MLGQTDVVEVVQSPGKAEDIREATARYRDLSHVRPRTVDTNIFTERKGNKEIN